MADHLSGITSINDSTPSVIIEEGLIGFYDWGLLNIGNFENVVSGELIRDTDPNYTDGQVWRCRHQNLVWESGVGAEVGLDNSNPGASGIYVDGTFYDRSTTGEYSYNFDHINGRVIFDSAIDTSSSVVANYSHKHIDVIPVKDLPNIMQVFYDRTEISQDLVSSGNYFNDPRASIDTPFIGVELVPRRGLRPYQLGGGQYVTQDVLFHCVSSDKEEANRMADIVTMQNDKTIRVFDHEKIYNSGVYPIDYNGVPVSGALRYPDLIDGYSNRHTLRMFNTRFDSSSNLSKNTIVKTIRVEAEIILNIT